MPKRAMTVIVSATLGVGAAMGVAACGGDDETTTKTTTTETTDLTSRRRMATRRGVGPRAPRASGWTRVPGRRSSATPRASGWPRVTRVGAPSGTPGVGN